MTRKKTAPEAVETVEAAAEKKQSPEETARKAAFDAGRAQGKREGYKKGFDFGNSQGWKDGMEAGLKEGRLQGRLEGKRDLVMSIEHFWAKAEGYSDAQKWADKGKIPAWWIIVLHHNLEPIPEQKLVRRKSYANLSTEELLTLEERLEGSLK